MRVAVCQMEPSTNLSETMRRIAGAAEIAAGDGSQLTVFPEAAVFPIHATGSELVEFAACVGDATTALAEIAARMKTAIVAGVFELSDSRDKVFNTVVGFASDGAPLGSYRKIHLYDAFGGTESERFVPGPLTPFSFALHGFRIGVLTCYDLRFPELARHLAVGGSDVLLVPAAWARGQLKEEHWTTLLRARAIENTCYVVAAAQGGSRCTGLSAVIDPMGVTIASLGESDGVVVADVRHDRLVEVREKLPTLRNRRFVQAVHG